VKETPARLDGSTAQTVGVSVHRRLIDRLYLNCCLPLVPEPRVPASCESASSSCLELPRWQSVVLRVPVLVAAALLLAACSGPPQSTDSGDSSSDRGPRATSPEEREARRATLASVETFDVSQYATPPPARELDVQHQVPVQLMQGRADEGVTQTIDGFRVQVYSAQDKQSAEEFRERVRQWWSQARGDAPEDIFRGQLPIVVEYGQPYYRVRIGAFASREEAAEALTFVQDEFADAFVARSTVTITR